MSSMRQDQEDMFGTPILPVCDSSTAVVGSSDGHVGGGSNTTSSINHLPMMSLQPVVMSLLRGLPGVAPVVPSPSPASLTEGEEGSGDTSIDKDAGNNHDVPTPTPTIPTTTPKSPSTTATTLARYTPLGDRLGGSVLPFATASKGVVPIEDAASLAQRLLVLCRLVSFRGDPAHTTGVEVRLTIVIVG